MDAIPTTCRKFSPLPKTRLMNSGMVDAMHSMIPVIMYRVWTGWNFSFRSFTIPVTPYRVSNGSFSIYSKREIRRLDTTNIPTAGMIISISTTSPMPPAIFSDQFSRPIACAPPSRISATGERMQSITPRATRREFSSLVFRNALASSISTVRMRLSDAVSGETSACSISSFSR